MERTELEVMLDTKLDPIRDAIAKLEKTQEQIVTLLTGQARMEEKLNGLAKEIEDCKGTHDEAFARIRVLEIDGGKKMWDVLKLIGATIFATLVGLAVGRMKG